ncbi:hypothetical protein SASPL_132564 [Salvia splendens]|uniref:Protein kinase domain-containing protein n=1 Tax=Salvia splendens TaxID=180675 RepID=A0A8X8WZQ7_SALSN|nr:hypothetical protein SASPL_132564 [Salvia splendens]
MWYICGLQDCFLWLFRMRIFRLLVVSLCCVSCLGQLPSQDTLALLEFKKGIKHDPTGFVVNSWNDESIENNGCPSSWNGIMCNGNNIAAVVLDNLGLSADVDLGVFSNLTMLVKLSIANNSISGKLERSLGDFKSLEYLDVSDNLLSSSLPSEIGKLASLKNLSLAGNNFSGAVPDSISGLASIRSLDMSRNSLSGPIPSSLTRLESLVYLNLSLNGFTKGIPNGLELMNKLDVLDLHGNMLDGKVDPLFLMLTNASHVDLSGNLLVNPAEDHKKFLGGVSSSLKYLNLSHNRIVGSLVGGGDAQAFGSLKVLDLSYNQLSGELPGFNFVYDLEVLKLGNNGFSGPVPNNLLKGDSLVLTELDLSRNNLSVTVSVLIFDLTFIISDAKATLFYLTGHISLITSTTLHTLNLSSNQLSGELPLLTGSCAVMDMSRNNFQGNLTRLVKWEKVEILDLSQNQLTGPIPEATAQFLRLNHLNLSCNSLNGPLPKAIARFPKLATLDLSFNGLGGPLLPSLLMSETLAKLHLQGNAFSGTIEFSPLFNITNLLAIDLSDNGLSGELPDGFGLITGLERLNVGRNNFSGSLPSSFANLTRLSSLDISGNHFTGHLPENLSDSLVSFNASYNDLSGVVPDNLRRFPLSSFYPGNSALQFPNPPPGPRQGQAGNNHPRTIVIVAIVVSCVAALTILILLVVFIRHKRKSKRPSPVATTKDVSRTSTNPSSVGGQDRSSGLHVSAGDLARSRKGSSSEIIDPEEKLAALTGFSPSKTSHFSRSPESGDSYTMESLSRLEAGSPDRLAGELYFLDDTVSFTAEELSRAPAEVLGRSSHGTSYRATLENGMLLTVKWLREGVAKQRKEFAREAKKFSNIRHPNVVGLRGYYWGPTQHEKLILSDYISPGDLASFLYGNTPSLYFSDNLPSSFAYNVVCIRNVCLAWM